MAPSRTLPAFILATPAYRHRITRAGRSILRQSSTTTANTTPSDAALASSIPARWLSDLKRRIGYCIIFGLKDEQIDEAGSIARILAKEWREWVAGSEGFLAGKHRAGIEGRAVEWGEMVSMGDGVLDRYMIRKELLIL